MNKALLKLSISTIVSVFAYTLVFPLITTSLLSRGYSGVAVGVMASMVYLVIFALGGFIPTLIRRLGGSRSYTLGKVALTCGFALLTLSDAYGVWLFASSLLGFGAAIIWPMTEGAIARFSPADKKGRVAGLYQAGLGLALTVGPFLSAALSVNKNRIFLSATLISLVAWIGALGFPWPDEQKMQNESSGSKMELKLILASGLVIAAFIGGIFESGLNSIIIAVGIHLGLNSAVAISLAGVIGLGSFLGPYPVGRLSDHIGIHRVLTLSLAVLALSMTALLFVKFFLPLIWILAFIWGVLGAGLYTISLASVASYFQDSLVLGATTLMISLYTLGAFVGPFLGGISFNISKDYGLPVVFTLVAAFSLFIHLVFLKKDLKIFPIQRAEFFPSHE